MSYPSEVLADSPGGYWRLNEASGSPQDSSGNGNHVTTVGGTPTYSLPGASAELVTGIARDGATGYMSVPDAATLDLGDVYTVEAWIKTTSAGVQGICSKMTGAYYLRVNAGVLELLRSATVKNATGTITVNDGKWHHVVATKSTTSIHLYVDTVDGVTINDTSAAVNNTNTLLIGADTTINDEVFNGVLDEIAVYPTALSLDRVKAHYYAAIYQILTPVRMFEPSRIGPF